MSSLKPTDVLSVADDLSKPYADLHEGDWDAVEFARYRSAASRAYYAVFLTLKARLAASNHEVPEDGGHTRLQRALKDALPPGHKLPMVLARLWTMRKEADYHLGGGLTRVEAEDRCDESAELIELIGNLSASKIDDIGNRLN